MNGKLLAAIFATLALAAVSLAAPAEQKAAVAADARFREAVKEADAAFRQAAVAEVNALASIAKNAISGGSGSGFSIWSIIDFTGLLRKLFGQKSSSSQAGNAIAQAENLLRVRRSPSVEANAQLEEAVNKSDAAFRQAAVAEVNALASIAKNAISGGSGSGFSIWSIIDFTGLLRKLFGQKSSSSQAGNAIAQAENLLRVRRSPDGGSDGSKDNGNNGGGDGGNNGGSDNGNKGSDSNGSSSAGSSSCGTGLIAMIKKLFGLCSSGSSSSSSNGNNGGNN